MQASLQTGLTEMKASVITNIIYTGHLFELVHGEDDERAATPNPDLRAVAHGEVLGSETWLKEPLDEPLEIVGVVSSLLLAGAILAGK